MPQTNKQTNRHSSTTKTTKMRSDLSWGTLKSSKVCINPTFSMQQEILHTEHQCQQQQQDS